ncbi:MAG: WD40/YVTN/BNR-like repeat-containing protein [Haloferacaceae archaeon]
MTLLIGTPAGLYRVDAPATDGRGDAGDALVDAEPVVDAAVERVRVFDGVAYAATSSGLHRSTDGVEWERLEVYGRDVTDALATPDGRLFVGTAPVGIYHTEDRRHWYRCDAATDLPDRERWRDRSHRGDAQVRTLAAHPDAPDRILAGIESGGVIATEDGGETWETRSTGVHDDVHHLLAVDADTVLAATGSGLYRTTDAGATWLRLDTDHRDFWHAYHRESVVHDGTLYAAALALGREEMTRRGALFEGEVAADARTWRRVDHPGQDEAFVVSFGVHDGDLLAGTMRVRNGFERNQPARVLRRGDDGWETLGRVPAAALSLAAL